MPVDTKKTDAVTVPFHLSEESIAIFKDNLRIIINSRPDTVTLDCSNLEQVISRHVNLLWETRIDCVNAGLGIRLIHITSGLRRILELLDIYDIFFDGEAVSVPARWTCELAPDKKLLHATLDQVDHYLAGFNIPSLTIFEIKTIFYEIVMNICLYAGLSATERVSIEISCADSSLCMIFRDNGVFFDPTSAEVVYSPATSIKNSQKRGFGLVMINKMADKITYTRENGTVNVLTVEKRWN